MDYEREQLINGLKALNLNYNFSRFSNDQLKRILEKERAYRFRLCCEINDLSREIGQEKGHEVESLYHSQMTKEELKALKKRALEVIERRDIRRQIRDIIEELNIDPNEILSLTIKRQPVTLDDFREIRDILLKKIQEMYNPPKKETKPNYDKSYALGDDPMMSEIDYEVILPKEKVRKMINILDNLRRKCSSSYIRCLSKEFYSRITKKYRNLDENYKNLTSIDFECLINLFNKATEDLEIEQVNELEYRHYR